MKDMTIGQLARHCGVGVQTIRYYERNALLPRAARNASGYRIYGPAARDRILFIRQAKGLGFTLAEIRDLLFLQLDDSASCMEINEIAQEKIQNLEQRITALSKMRDSLQDLIRNCRQGRSAAECQMLLALLGDQTSASADQE